MNTQKILKAGSYKTKGGMEFTIEEDVKPLCEHDGDWFYTIETEMESTIIPRSRIIFGEEYSSDYSSSSDSSHTGTDTTGGKAKPLKKKKKKPTTIRRSNTK